MTTADVILRPGGCGGCWYLKHMKKSWRRWRVKEDTDVCDRIPIQVWKEGKLNREGILINGQTQVFLEIILEIILQNALRGKQIDLLIC